MSTEFSGFDFELIIGDEGTDLEAMELPHHCCHCCHH